jgi:hypothetical protein
MMLSCSAIRWNWFASRELRNGRGNLAASLGAELAKSLPEEPVGVYAGTGKSGLFRGGDFASVEREDIKKAVKKREIRLLVVTDAACEGLNLQNPWESHQRRPALEPGAARTTTGAEQTFRPSSAYR